MKQSERDASDARTEIERDARSRSTTREPGEVDRVDVDAIPRSASWLVDPYAPVEERVGRRSARLVTVDKAADRGR
jgi:hypothetical protein